MEKGKKMHASYISCSFLFFIFFGPAQVMLRFLGQGSHPYHSCNQNHSNNKTRSLTLNQKNNSFPEIPHPVDFHLYLTV